MPRIRDPSHASLVCTAYISIMNSSWTVILLIIVARITTFVAADTILFCSRPSCSHPQKEGTFTSPEYPYTFQSKIDSRTYKFEGEYGDRIQIIFDEFQMYEPEPNEVCGKQNSYLYYRRSDASAVFLCQKPLPILSHSNLLLLEYRQPSRNFIARDESMDEMKGFNASYRFIKNFGIDNGNQTSDGCEFTYDSAASPRGIFQSPNFNGYYPGNMECTYYFKGTENYLNINFTEFNLLGSESCSEAYDGDYLELSQTTDRDPAFYYERVCGRHERFSITVNGSTFFIIFKSSQDHLNESSFSPDRPFVGFRATYTFTNETSSVAHVMSQDSLLSLFLFTSSFFVALFQPGCGRWRI